MSEKYIINGLFLTQTLSGVHRYAVEIIKELDKICDKNVWLAIPQKAKVKNYCVLRNIQIIKCGLCTDRLWENIDYYRLLKKEHARGINLCNTAPLKKVDLIVIHDVGYKNSKEIRELGGNKVKLFFRDIQNNIYCKKAKKIVTVSNFSRREIMKYFRITNNDISVIGNSWQHYEKIQTDCFDPKDKRITSGKYYFALSNLSDHKNIKWIIEEAKYNPEEIFVVAGRMDKRYFKFSTNLANYKNIIYVGRITDEEAKGYMANCKAFLSPSLYEGFGIPPLEALSAGTNIIISDIPAHREIFGEAACYINPRKSDYRISHFIFPDESIRNEVLKHYSWNQSAKDLYRIMQSM